MKNYAPLLLSFLWLTQVGFATATETPSEASSQTPALSDQLNALEIPENEVPLNVSQEKLYSVQDRYIPLKSRFELSLMGAQNLTGDSFLVTRDVGLGVRYHFTDRFNLGISGSKTFNRFSDAGRRLQAQEAILPDSAYASYRLDMTASYHLFYGKFRISMEKVLYFDQYISLGAGVIGQNSETTPTVVGDIGLSFWIGQWGGLRFGFKDYFYNEKRVLSSGWNHNLLGHLDFVWLLGGGNG